MRKGETRYGRAYEDYDLHTVTAWFLRYPLSLDDEFAPPRCCDYSWKTGGPRNRVIVCIIYDDPACVSSIRCLPDIIFSSNYSDAFNKIYTHVQIKRQKKKKIIFDRWTRNKLFIILYDSQGNLSLCWLTEDRDRDTWYLLRKGRRARNSAAEKRELQVTGIRMLPRYLDILMPCHSRRWKVVS